MPKADNLTTFMCCCHEMGTLNSWNPLGQSRPVTGLLYLSTVLLIVFSIMGHCPSPLSSSLYQLLIYGILGFLA